MEKDIKILEEYLKDERVIYSKTDIIILKEHLGSLIKECQKYQNRCDGALSYIEDRKENMCIDHYDDLKYILNESACGEW